LSSDSAKANRTGRYSLCCTWVNDLTLKKDSLFALKEFKAIDDIW